MKILLSLSLFVLGCAVDNPHFEGQVHEVDLQDGAAFNGFLPANEQPDGAALRPDSALEDIPDSERPDEGATDSERPDEGATDSALEEPPGCAVQNPEGSGWVTMHPQAEVFAPDLRVPPCGVWSYSAGVRLEHTDEPDPPSYRIDFGAHVFQVDLPSGNEAARCSVDGTSFRCFERNSRTTAPRRFLVRVDYGPQGLWVVLEHEDEYDRVPPGMDWAAVIVALGFNPERDGLVTSLVHAHKIVEPDIVPGDVIRMQVSTFDEPAMRESVSVVSGD